MEKQPQNVRDLIYFFTHNKNLTRQQQARRDKLLARDCIAIDKRTETNAESQELLVDQGDASTKKLKLQKYAIYHLKTYTHSYMISIKTMF